MSNRFLDDLHALVTPGVGATTVHPEPVVVRVPRGWDPGVVYAPDGGSMVVTTTAVTGDARTDPSHWKAMVTDLGLTVPEGWRVRLVEAKYDPVAWTRDTPEQDKAVTRAVWRYRFAVEPDPGSTREEDVAALVRDAVKVRRRRKPSTVDGRQRGLVVVYADPQAGKVDQMGGTAALAGRIASCFEHLDDYIADLKRLGRPATEAAWLDAGDAIEGIDNAAAQAHTNDLSTTQQIRVHRRVTFHGLDYLAARFGRVTAATCGSNHAAVRRGKDRIGPPDDDWGIEVMSQVQEAYAHNLDAFGHVRFAYPPAWRDTVRVDVAGMQIGLAHGHQPNNGNVVRWWKDQTFGDQPVASARILVTGHFHHWATKDCGDGKLWVQAPTLDNGSTHFTLRTGEVSSPGMLVFTVTEDGWDDMRILRP